MSAKKALIFGYSGFVAKYLTQELISNGYIVVGSDKESPDSALDEVPFVKADLLDAAAIEELFIDVNPDVIINLAAISSVGLSWKEPQMTVSVNVIGALNLIEAARHAQKQPKIMLIGSSEEYETCDQPLSEKSPLNANNPYGVSKIAQERFAELYRTHYDLKIYYVRSFNHTGIGQSDSFVLPSFCKQVAKINAIGKPGSIMVGNLNVQRDFSDVRDIVRAYRMVIESEDCAKIYNIGSGKAVTLRELLQFTIGLGCQQVSIEESSNLFRPDDTERISCNCELINKELGWAPRYDITETLTNMYNHYLTVFKNSPSALV